MSSFLVEEGWALVESAHHRGELAVEKGAGHERGKMMASKGKGPCRGWRAKTELDPGKGRREEKDLEGSLMRLTF